MDQHQEIEPGLVAELGHQICQGLSYIHHLHDLEKRHLHLVHRDLKPSNVLVHRSGRVKITDFGVVSARAREQITARDTIIGTPRYMSPEQAVAAEVSPASDLYSLGVMLMQGLTAVVPVKLPYQRGKAVEEVAPDPEKLLDDLPEAAQEFRPLLLRLLQPRATDRPESAEEVAEELAELRTLYPMEQRFSALVEDWIEKIAEESDEAGLEGLPSDRSGDFSILGDSMLLDASEGPVDVAGNSELSGAARRPAEWEEPTDRDENTSPSAVGGGGGDWRVEPTDKEDARPIEEGGADAPATAEGGPTAAVGRASAPGDVEVSDQPQRRRPAWPAVLFVLLLVFGIGSLAALQLLARRGQLDVSEPGAEGAATSTEGIESSPTRGAEADDLSEIVIADDAPGSAEAADGPGDLEAQEEPEPQEEPPEPPPEVSEPVPPEEALQPPPPEPRDDGDGLTSASGGEPPANPQTAEPGEGAPLALSVSGQRRILRNSTLHTGIDTGTTGCRVDVHWAVEGTGAWHTLTLPGDGPEYTWSLSVTAEHRPAILYHVEVSACGNATYGSGASPMRVVVR